MIVAADFERTAIGGLGAVAGAAGLATIAGLPGAGAGLAVLLVWVLVGDLPAFAAGAVALGATAPESVLVADGSGVVSLALLEHSVVGLGMAPLLLGGVRRAERPLSIGALVLVLWIGLAMTSMAPVAAGESALLGTGALVVVFAAIAYVLHRYALLVSGVLQRG